MSTKLFRFLQKKKNSFTKDGVTTGVQYVLLFIVIFYYMWQGEPKLQPTSLAAVDNVSGSLVLNNSSPLLIAEVSNSIPYTTLQLGSSINRYQSSNFDIPGVYKNTEFILRLLTIKKLERNKGVPTGILLFSETEIYQTKQVVTKEP